VLVALGEIIFGDDFAAAGEEGFAKIFGEADAVGVGDAGEDGDLGGFQIVLGELGHDGALEGINEADAENVIAGFGDLGIGRGGGDHWDFAGLGNGGGFEGAAGGDFADERDDFFAGDEFLRGGGAFAGLCLVVLGDEFD